MGMAYIHWIGGDRTSAAREFDEAIAVLRVIGERWGLATTLSASADLADARVARIFAQPAFHGAPPARAGHKSTFRLG